MPLRRVVKPASGLQKRIPLLTAAGLLLILFFFGLAGKYLPVFPEISGQPPRPASRSES